MRTSSSSSLSDKRGHRASGGKRRIWAAVAVSAITLHPYGNVSKLLAKKNPWTVFRADGPVLTTVRVQKATITDCRDWLRALVEDRKGIHPLALARDPAKQSWKGWLPFDSDELKQIRGCDSFPCDVKLDRAEVGQMTKTTEKGRTAEFLSLVLDRAKEYAKSGKARPYEFPGGVADPWELFRARGLRTSLAMPKKPSFGLRLLKFDHSRVRPIRQVLDRRTALSRDGRQASVWVKAVYTDHYFDSWGEWANAQCIPAQKQIIVTMALSLEFDLLKKTDLLSMLAKGTMRSSVHKLSTRYLDRWWTEIKSKADAKK